MAIQYPDLAAEGSAQVVTDNLRAPSGVTRVNGTLVWTFDPPLTAQEQTTLNDLEAWQRSGLDVSLTDYRTVRTNLQVLRDLRQLGRNPFMALTAADRDRMIYDALVADTVIWLAVLRE